MNEIDYCDVCIACRVPYKNLVLLEAPSTIEEFGASNSLVESSVMYNVATVFGGEFTSTLVSVNIQQYVTSRAAIK